MNGIARLADLKLNGILVMTLLSFELCTVPFMKDLVCFRSTAGTTGHEQWLMYYVDCKWHGMRLRH